MSWSRRRDLWQPYPKMVRRNNILMYSTYTEGKSVVAKWFIRSLKGTKPIKNDSW